MAELNFGLLTPPGSQSIGNAFVQGMDQAAVARAQENQNALSQYTLSKARREDELTNQMLAGMQGADTIEKQADVLRRGGKYREANELLTSGLARDIKKGELAAQPGAAARTLAQTNAANAALVRSRQQFEGQALRDLGVNPSDDNIRALGQDAVIKGIYTQEEADQKVGQFLAIPLADRAANFSRYGAPAAAPQQPRQPNMATDLLIPGPNGTMVPNTALIGVKKELRPAGTTVNVKLPAVEGEYGKTMAKNTAEEDIKMLGAARNAPKVAGTANRVMELLANPDIFVGPAAAVKLNAARALNVLGADETESMRNTEKLIAAAGQGTLDAIKDAGLGTGQGFTAKDLEFLTNVAGGKIEFTAENLRTMARLQHRAAETSVKRWQDRRSNMPKSATEGTGIDKETYELPARMGGPTPESIAYLKANPNTKAAFNKRYGDGEAEHTLRMGK
jgi:hypothetical protein